MVALSNNQILLSLSLSSSQSANPRKFNHLAGFSYIRRRAPQQYSSHPLGNSPASYIRMLQRQDYTQLLTSQEWLMIKRAQLVSAKNYEAGQSEDAEEIVHKASDDLTGSLEDKTIRPGSSFLAKLAIALGVAAITLLSIGLKQLNQGSNFGIQYLVDGSSSSTISTPAPGFSFKAFGYRVMLPEYAPGLESL